jgi:hypothetical protein
LCLLRNYINEGVENRILRRIFGPKRDEVAWEWRKLHNKELNNLYSGVLFFNSQNLRNIVQAIKLRRKRWAGHVARMGEEKYIHGLVGKSEGKKQLGRPGCKWEDNVKVDL